MIHTRIAYAYYIPGSSSLPQLRKLLLQVHLELLSSS
jgi:hypothetical protein